MGEKVDDVIDDSSEPTVTIVLPPLKPNEQVWVVTYLNELGEKPTETGEPVTGTEGKKPAPIDAVPKGPTPAEVMLKAVNDPRPSDLTAPEGANGEETIGIDTLHAQLVSHLQSHDGGNDLTLAEGMVVAIRDAIGKVPLRIARDLEDRREQVRGQLALLKVPGGLPEPERLPLAEKGVSLDKSIGGAKEIGTLEDLSLAVTTHGDKLREAAEAVVRRTKAAESLSLRIGNATPPDQALPSEATPLRERGEALLLRLAPPLSDAGLERVTTDTGTLELDVKTLAETVARRDERAETLRLRLKDITPAAGLPEDEASSFRLLVTGAVQTIKTPYSPEMLDKADKLAGELEGAALQQVVAVSDRARRAEALKLRLNGVTAPLRVTPQEAEDLRLNVEKARLLLAAPHVVLTLDGVDKTAGELEGQLKTLAEAVIKRDQRAKLVDTRMTLLTDPAGLNDTEIDDLKNARAAARKELVDPPTEAALTTAEAKADEAVLLGKTVAKAISDRADKRQVLTGALDLLDLPANALPADFRLRSKTQTALRKQIAEANATDTLTTAEQAVEAEKKIVAGMIDLLSERALAETDIRNARTMLKDQAQAADQGFLGMLQAAVIDADKVLPTLSDKAGVATLRKGIADVTGKLADSLLYADALRTFLVNATLRLKAPGIVDAPKVAGAIETVRLAAQKKSIVMDYAAARLELAKFETLAGLTVGDLAASGEWQVTLKAFATTYQAKLTLIEKSRVPDPTNTLLVKVATARKIPPVGVDVKVAGTALNSHGAQITALAAVAEVWQRFASLKTAASPAVTDVDKAYAAALLNLTATKYPQALANFAGLTGTNDEKKALARARLSRLQASNGNIDPSAAAGKLLIKNLLQTVTPKITSNAFGDATSIMNSAETKITQLTNWVEPANAVKALKTLHDNGNTYHFSDTADTKASTHLYDQALPLLLTAAANLRKLGEVLAAKARAQGLRDTQVASTPPHAKCVKALTDANNALVTDKDPVKALGVFTTLFADTTLKVMAADIGVWLARFPGVDRATKKTAAMIVDVAPRQALEKSLKDAADQATAHTYRAALDMLDRHEPLLGQARAFVQYRERAVAVDAALLRAETEMPVETGNIVGGVAAPGRKKLMDDCVKLAAKTDFDAATKEFQKFLKACEAMTREVAKLCEARDGAGSNAGHSLDRHGSEVSDEDMLRRLQTGIAPDNKESTCVASSKFESMEAWLSGREKAVKAAENAGITLDVSEYDLTTGDPVLEFSVEIDHGGPIDKAVAGIKPNTEVKTDGTFDDADTYESFKELSGITKSTSKMVFVIDPPPDGNMQRPRDLKVYKERFKKLKDKENKDAQDIWDLAPLPKPPVPVPQATIPTKVPGHWVMMQHFPLVKGWDQEKGDYIV